MHVLREVSKKLFVFADLLLPIVFTQKKMIPVWDKPQPFPCGSYH